MKINALLVCAVGSDATSYYRGIVPFKMLEKQVDDLTVTVMETDQAVDPNRLRCADILIMQRPVLQWHLNLMVDAQIMGIPIWVDYDDDFRSIGEDNPAIQAYAASGELISECFKIADAVTVSTPLLKESFKDLNENIFIVPNSFDDSLLPKKKENQRSSGEKIVLWRGGSSHLDNLVDVVGSVKKHVEKHPDWVWVFMGINPRLITREIPKEKFRHVPFSSTISYLNVLNNTQPDIVMIPLVDNHFNRCRSNNGWVEASFANAAVLAPNWDTWDQPGITNYTDSNGFHQGLEYLMSCSDIRDKSTRAWEFIKENLLLSKTNELRWDIMNKLNNFVRRPTKWLG